MKYLIVIKEKIKDKNIALMFKIEKPKFDETILLTP